VTATPARHGPAGGDRGPVIGFVLRISDGSLPPVYVSGDTAVTLAQAWPEAPIVPLEARAAW
jgi:hypothetical protein